MESEMDALVVNMDAIAAKSRVVNESLAGKRHEIDKLVRVRRLLKRLEFIFELPARLAEVSPNRSWSDVNFNKQKLPVSGALTIKGY